MSLLKSYKILKTYRADPLAFIQKVHHEQGHRVQLNIFGKNLFIVSHPEDVLHVLKNNPNAYTKGRTTKALRQFLGNGLITNEGESWRKQYRLIRPIMNLKSIYDIAPKILATTEEFISEIDMQPDVDVLREMNRLTWRIVLNTLFSQKVTSEMDDWLEDILDLMKIITAKTRSSIPLPFWLPTRNHRRMKKILKKFDHHVYGLIEDRRKGTRKQDLLQLLIDAREVGTADMTDREIRDEIMTFMMAGHETITNSMSWTLIELAKHPEYRKKLEDEAIEFNLDKNFEKLNSMPWHTAVIDEVMRLWPPVWVFMREAEVEDHFSGVVVPPKANVVLAPFLTHRSKDFWENPEQFYPERFLPSERKKIIQGSFYPFGLGPRSCIGSLFAGMEAKIILSTIVQNFEWSIDNLQEQESDAGISLRPSNNIVMNFRRKA